MIAGDSDSPTDDVSNQCGEENKSRVGSAEVVRGRGENLGDGVEGDDSCRRSESIDKASLRMLDQVSQMLCCCARRGSYDDNVGEGPQEEWSAEVLPKGSLVLSVSRDGFQSLKVSSLWEFIDDAVGFA